MKVVDKIKELRKENNWSLKKIKMLF